MSKLLSLRPGLADQTVGKEYLPPKWSQQTVLSVLEAIGKGSNVRATVVASGMLTSDEYDSLRSSYTKKNAHPQIVQFFQAADAAYAKAEVLASIQLREKKPDAWIATGRPRDWSPASRTTITTELQSKIDALTSRFATRPDILDEILECLIEQ